jgi:polyhydroxyalkanoate synthesis regulator phasin
MSDLFHKGFQAGLGAGLLLSEGVVTKAREMLQSVGNIPELLQSRTDTLGAGIAKELESLRVQGEEQVARVLADVGLASKQDLDALQARVEQLESIVAELRGRA